MSATRSARAGAIVWLTGLPASGKTTLAGQIRERLVRERCPVVVLDGDEVRAALATAPRYDEKARAGFYETLGRLALTLEKQGLIVLVPATAHRRAWRDAVRARAGCFVEVYVRATRDEAAARDVKGLYEAARAGAAPDLPGAGVAYEPPLHPEVAAHGGRDPHAVDRTMVLLRR